MGLLCPFTHWTFRLPAFFSSGEEVNQFRRLGMVCKRTWASGPTVRQIVYQRKKFSTTIPLHGTGRPTKIGVMVNCKNLQRVTQNHRVTAKDLPILRYPDTWWRQSSTRKTVFAGGYQREKHRFPEEKTLLSISSLQKSFQDVPKLYWKIILWTDEMQNIISLKDALPPAPPKIM